MKALRSLLIVSLFALATTASAQTTDWKFEFHGFVSGSLYYQDQAFGGGQGQSGLTRAPTPANEVGGSNAPATSTSGSLIGGDTRQSRWIFVMTGPVKVFDATAKANFEVDFTGSPAAGTFAAQGWSPRIREFYSELNWGSTQLSVGQRNDLFLINGAETLAHIGSPYSFGAGFIGFRQPGLRGTFGIPFEGSKLTIAVEATANRWDSGPGVVSAGPGATTPQTIDRGEASGMPMFQARVMYEGVFGPVTTNINAEAEYHSVNLKGFGDILLPNGITLADGSNKTSISGTLFQVGTRTTFNVGIPLHLRANFYTGNATGNRAGGSYGQLGDMKDMGYFGQLGANFTPEVSLWFFYGHTEINKDDLRNWFATAPATLPDQNNTIAGMVRYSKGGYAFGLEYINCDTTYITGSFAAPGADQSTKATQIIGTANYSF